MKLFLPAPRWSLLFFLCTLCACNLFSERRHSPEKASIPAGHWRLDSIAAPEGKREMALLVIAMAAKDSANSITDFYFTPDSVYYDFNDEDTTRASYRLQPEHNLMVLHSENEVDTLRYQFTEDSTMVLTGNDSVSLYLRRR